MPRAGARARERGSFILTPSKGGHSAVNFSYNLIGLTVEKRSSFSTESKGSVLSTQSH